ncbi:MAG TPA: hypothetical protein VF534_02160 [Paraburkholderia sp.]
MGSSPPPVNATASAAATGTATDAGALLDGDFVQASRGAGFLQTTRLKAAQYVMAFIMGLSGQGTLTVDNVAAMQALSPSVYPRVKTRGYYAPGDGGHGEYDAKSGTADGGAFISATGGTYKLRYVGSIHALQYGAYGDNTHDDTAALQALETYCNTNRLWMNLSGPYTWRVTSQLTFTHPCLFEGGNSVICADTVAGFTASPSVVNYVGNGSNALNALGAAVRNLKLRGPQWSGSQWNYWPDITQPSVSAVDGLYITGSSVTVSNVVTDGLEILGFRDNLAFAGSNNYIHQFKNCTIGGAWRNGININFTTNSGERIDFSGVKIFNCVNSLHTACAVNDTMAGAGSADLYFHGGSIDYNDGDFNVSTTRAFMYGVHRESNTANANDTLTFVSGKPWPEIHQWGGSLITGGGVNPFGNSEPAGGKSQWINVTSGAGGHYRVTLDGVIMQVKSGSSIVFPQDGLLGQESIRGLSVQYSNAFLPAVNYYSSAVVNGRFNQLGGNINGWTLTTDANGAFSYDSSTTTGNSRSMKFVSTAASTDSAQQILPFKAGDVILIRGSIKISSYVAGSTRLVLYFYAGDGTTLIGSYVPFNSVGSNQNPLSANTAGFASIGSITQAPAGTGKVVMAWEQTGLNATAWLAGVDAWKI